VETGGWGKFGTDGLIRERCHENLGVKIHGGAFGTIKEDKVEDGEKGKGVTGGKG